MQTIQEVFEHHLDAFLNLDAGEIIKDYTEQSILYTPNGEIKGLEGIKGFFDYVFTLLPKESFQFNTAQKIQFDNYVYLAFNCSSALVDVVM